MLRGKCFFLGGSGECPGGDVLHPTTDVESESERIGPSSVRVLRSRSVPASDVPLTSSRATEYSRILNRQKDGSVSLDFIDTDHVVHKVR